MKTKLYSNYSYFTAFYKKNKKQKIMSSNRSVPDLKIAEVASAQDSWVRHHQWSTIYQTQSTRYPTNVLWT